MENPNTWIRRQTVYILRKGQSMEPQRREKATRNLSQPTWTFQTHTRRIYQLNMKISFWRSPAFNGNRADPGNGHFPNIQVWILVPVLWGFGRLVFKMFLDRQKSSRQDAWYQNCSALLTSSSEHTVYRSTSQVLKSAGTFERMLCLLVGYVYQSNWRNFWLTDVIWLIDVTCLNSYVPW